MSDFTASLPTTLFKASQGYVNTKDDKSLAQEPITARQATYSDRVFTNTIPTNAPTDLSSIDEAWTVGGTRAFSTASPWIVKYTNIPLVAATSDEGNDKTYMAIAAPAGLTRGFVPPSAGENVLTNAILPRPYASTSTLYGITVTKGDSPLDTTQYIFNRDAGTIKIYLPNVSASELKATFWRYEGRFLSNIANTDVSGTITLGNKIYVGNTQPTDNRFSTALHITNSNGAADLILQDISTGAALRMAAHDTFGANMIQSGISLDGNSAYPVSIGKMRSDVVTTIIDVSQQKVLIGDLKIPRTATTTDGILNVLKDISHSKRAETNPFQAQVSIRGTTERNRLLLGSYGVSGENGLCGTIQAAKSTNADGTGTYDGTNLLLNPIGGFVGIGTSEPATTLHLYKPSTGSQNLLRLESDVQTYGGSDDGPGIEFYTKWRGNNTSYFQASIQGIDDVNQESGRGGLKFNTNDATIPSEKMRISSNGNVGIGKASPSTTLDVSGTTTISRNLPMSEISNNALNSQLILNGSTTTNRLVLGSYYTANVGTPGVIQASDFYDGKDNPAFLYLNPKGGNVGIGTTTPQSVLDVNGATTLRGNVGIGTTTQQSVLDVNGATTLRGNLSVNNGLTLSTKPYQKYSNKAGTYNQGGSNIGSWNQGSFILWDDLENIVPTMGVMQSSGVWRCDNDGIYVISVGRNPYYTQRWSIFITQGSSNMNRSNQLGTGFDSGGGTIIEYLYSGNNVIVCSSYDGSQEISVGQATLTIVRLF